MSQATLSATLVLFNGEVQQVPPPPENCEVVVISVHPENTQNTSEVPLVTGSYEAAALASGPSQRVVPSYGPPGEPEGQAASPSVILDIHYHDSTDVASGTETTLPRRIMGDPASLAHVPWGKEGDECVICLGVMAAGEHVTDLPGCNHTYPPPRLSLTQTSACHRLTNLGKADDLHPCTANPGKPCRTSVLGMRFRGDGSGVRVQGRGVRGQGQGRGFRGEQGSGFRSEGSGTTRVHPATTMFRVTSCATLSTGLEYVYNDFGCQSLLPKSPQLRILKHTGLPRSKENARTPRTPIGMVLL